MYSPKYHRFMFDGIPPFRNDGVSCKIIPLNRNYFTIVNANDYDWLMQWKWTAYCQPKGNVYAMRDGVTNGERHRLYMHRVILGLEFGDPRVGDHVNSLDTLDNRRQNLRIATQAENMRNMKLRANSKTGYRGVHRIQNSDKFRARLKVDGKVMHLGRRDTAEAAYWELYVPAALKYQGRFSGVWDDVNKEIAKI